MSTNTARKHTVESAVHDRYAQASQAVEPALCCPTSYPSELLEVIPQEVIERDYGCGDPTPFAKEGDTVLDLGSGGGKLCYMLAQVVGSEGRIIGVDCNRDMLALARGSQPVVAERLGYDNVRFHYGMIQNLKLDLDLLGEELKAKPVENPHGWLTLRHAEERLSKEQPMIADNSVDCVVSNCVLNLVRQADRKQLFSEVFRVLKKGGRAAISDIVSDEDVPEEMQNDPELWSGCISGAYREDKFLEAFEQAGFHGVTIATRQSSPWRTIKGIEFRSVTVLAYKGKQGACFERNQAVVYRGPFKKVHDDDGHAYPRGERIAVCDKTYKLLQQEPYAGLFETIDPLVDIPLNEAKPFDCRRTARRDPHESKGRDYDVTTEASGDVCCDGEACC